MTLNPEILRHMGVSLKRSVYFITCNGKYSGGNMLGRPELRRRLWQDEFVFSGNMEQLSMMNYHLLPVDYDVSV